MNLITLAMFSAPNPNRPQIKPFVKARQRGSAGPRRQDQIEAGRKAPDRRISVSSLARLILLPVVRGFVGSRTIKQADREKSEQAIKALVFDAYVGNLFLTEEEFVMRRGILHRHIHRRSSS